jgi:molybdenum cofactor cytidylyltransferase
MNKPVGAIVLAAGFSSRFGGAKLLAKLATGSTVLQQTVERIGEALPAVLVVTRPELSMQLQALPGNVQLLNFDQAERGMGASLAFAAKHIAHWSGCVVCLADMPFIQSATYRQIAEQVRQDRIVIPYYDSTAGNPVAFGCRFFSELITLQGDTGGRQLIRSQPESVLQLALTDPGILQDIDTPEELARWQDSQTRL